TVLALPVLTLFAAAVGALLSTLLQLLVFGPIRRRAATRGQAELSVLIASIGAGLIPVAVALNLADAEVMNLPRETASTAIHQLGPARISTLQIAIVVLALVLTGALAWWISRRSAAGGQAGASRAQRAHRQHRGRSDPGRGGAESRRRRSDEPAPRDGQYRDPPAGPGADLHFADRDRRARTGTDGRFGVVDLADLVRQGPSHDRVRSDDGGAAGSPSRTAVGAPDGDQWRAGGRLRAAACRLRQRRCAAHG